MIIDLSSVEKVNIIDNFGLNRTNQLMKGFVKKS